MKAPQYLKEIKQEQIRMDMLAASNDLLFLADVNECSRGFRSVDQESSAQWYGQPAAAAAASEQFVLPDNLKKFFKAMQNKK